MKIAVINNDTVFLELMSELLDEEGYEVITWKEGDTAYEMVKDKKPVLIVLDIRLEQPESGWQLLEVLKLDPETRAIPVIVCSADAPFLRTKEERLQEMGCDTLEKPFELEELLAKVRAMSPRPK